MPDEGRTPTPCEPCRGTGLFRARNEPPDDCLTCGGTGWAGREATWTVEAEGDNCPLCDHGPEAHDGEGCSATEGYDHLNGFHECGCPLTPPARGTS